VPKRVPPVHDDMNEPKHLARIVYCLEAEICDSVLLVPGEQHLELVVSDRRMKDPEETRVNPFPYVGKITPFKAGYPHLYLRLPP